MGSNGKTPLDDWRFDGSGKFRIAKADPAAKPCTTGTKADDIARLAELSARLDTLQDILYAEHRRKLLVVLQGMDTSGKDGTVRGVFRAFDPLGLRVAGFKAPTPQELARDFLWRVHAQVPARGEIVIFNRSHYEDVLITRVHGDIDAAACKRRYEHIRAFERMLEDTGTTIVKCFLHLSRRNSARACKSASTIRTSTGNSIPPTSRSADTGTTTWRPTKTPSTPPRRPRRPGMWCRRIPSRTAT
ncbi:hypothetical protein ACEQUB_00033 [Ralstonia syzygii]